MLREGVLFDSPVGIVKIWAPDRQFSPYVEGGIIPPMSAQLRVVIVNPRRSEYSKGQVIWLRPYELRLRGFCTEGSMAVKPEDPPALRMKDLLYIAQKEIAELRDERAQLRTALQDAIKLLDASRDE